MKAKQTAKRSHRNSVIQVDFQRKKVVPLGTKHHKPKWVARMDDFEEESSTAFAPYCDTYSVNFKNIDPYWLDKL